MVSCLESKHNVRYERTELKKVETFGHNNRKSMKWRKF